MVFNSQLQQSFDQTLGVMGAHGDHTVHTVYSVSEELLPSTGLLPDASLVGVSLFRADPGHPGGILSLGRPLNPLRFPQRSWWKWLEGVSGPPCLNGIPL